MTSLKSIIFLLPFLLFVNTFSYSQFLFSKDRIDSIFLNVGEVYIQIDNKTNFLNDVANEVSISKISENSIYCFVNKNELLNITRKNIPVKLIESPTKNINYKLVNYISSKGIKTWDYYPTYSAYENLMYQFEADYPELCKLVVISTLSSGRKLFSVVISDSVSVNENEPAFLYTSSMHGNETSGFVIMLRMIDYLLSNYSSDSIINNLVNNTEIWINPLANPDGLYRDDNSTVQGATRGNANYIDLNRNFPDPDILLSGTDNGQHPDKNPWQEETIAFMLLAEENHFVLSANIHDGIEVVNYPWDTWSRKHADDNWYENISRAFADTIHNYSDLGYFDDCNNGITNGYQWYQIHGGRQDYNNYYQNGREVTIELTSDFLLSPSELPKIWNSTYRSFLNYIKLSLTGIHGVVIDSTTHNPIEAKIFINNHDIDSSEVYSILPYGSFNRFLFDGSYSLIVSANGYNTKTINNVIINNSKSDKLIIKLSQSDVSMRTKVQDGVILSLFPNPTCEFIDLVLNRTEEKSIIDIYDINCKIVYNTILYSKNSEKKMRHKIDVSSFSVGSYFIIIQTGNKKMSGKFVKI